MKKKILVLSLAITLLISLLFEAVVYQVCLFNARTGFIASVENAVGYEEISIIMKASASPEELADNIKISVNTPYPGVVVLVDGKGKIYYSQINNTANNNLFGKNDIEALALQGDEILKSESSAKWVQSTEKNESVLFTCSGAINGLPVVILIELRLDFLRATVNSDDFIFFTVENSVILLVCEIGIIILLLQYFRRKERFDKARNFFLTGVAHEIKTPVAGIVNLCDCISEGVSPEDNENFLGGIIHCADRITLLTDGFTKNGYLDSVEKVNREVVSLAEISKKETVKYVKLFSEKGISLTQEYGENTDVYAERALIAAVIDNFLSNAVKYTSEKGKVNISVTKLGKNCVYRISNSTDVGVDCKTIWDSAYKYDKGTGHINGVGLSICKKILHLHHFGYSCKKTEDGLEFSFTAKPYKKERR